MTFGKSIIVLLEFFIVLPILEARVYHGYNSYKQYYNYRINGEQLKHPTITSDEIINKITNEIINKQYKQYENSNDMKEQIKSRFEDTSKKTDLKNDFIFPDEFQARNSDDNYVQVARCNDKKQTFCEDVPYYPIDFVNQAIIRNSSLLHYAHEDIVNIAQRADIDEIQLCPSQERKIYPKSAENLNKQWRYILQSNETNFHQGIRVETCDEEDSTCKMIDGMISGYVTTCKQKYIYRELSAISEDGRIIRDFFRLPASCCCHIEFQPENIGKRISAFEETLQYRPQVLQKIYV
ncbi:hypothetical protein P5V15_010423 [Pogonomyrmex californicus]